jgi:ABC-type amino acid transport substrate-binding protein
MLTAGCSGGQTAKITQLSDLEGKIVATIQTPQDPAVMRAFVQQQAGAEFEDMLFFESLSAAVAALKGNQADAIFFVGPSLDFYVSRDAELTTLSLDPVGKATLHMALRADDTELLTSINAALAGMKDDGTLARLEKEFITDLTADAQLAGREMPRFDDAPTLTVGLAGDMPPVDYVAADGNPGGYNVEMLALLGEKLKVNFEISVMPLESKFPALATGKIDVFFLHPVNDDVAMLRKDMEANNNATLTESYFEFSDIGFFVMK